MKHTKEMHLKKMKIQITKKKEEEEGYCKNGDIKNKQTFNDPLKHKKKRKKKARANFLGSKHFQFFDFMDFPFNRFYEKDEGINVQIFY